MTKMCDLHWEQNEINTGTFHEEWRKFMSKNTFLIS